MPRITPFTAPDRKPLRGVALIVLGLSAIAAAQDDPIDIGSRRELFVDDLLIDRLDNAERRLHHPTPGEAVLQFDQPWEGRYCGYITVIEDDGLFRMYYRGRPDAGADGSPEESTCYAESEDGVAWSKPNLGLFEMHGTKDNNVILSDAAPYTHNFAPFLDTRPGVPDDERYKALAGTRKTGLAAWASADGLRWRKLVDTPVITEGAFDSQNIAFWSPSEEQYVSYFRIFEDGVRSISRTTSKDFRAWADPTPMTYGGTPREHLYTNQTKPYLRAPHIYLAVAARFMPGRRVVSVAEAEALGGEAKYSGDCSDVVLMSTRGGNVYDRSFMEAFIRPGPGLENWTSRTNYPAHGILQTGDELSIYVQRRYGQLDHYLQRFTLRLDGFVSVYAGYEGGELVTKPIRFTGNTLKLNAATSAAGSIVVEIQGSGGNPLPGFGAKDCDPWIGDWTGHAVTWNGESTVADLAGKPVRLRFEMRDADLYALQFE